MLYYILDVTLPKLDGFAVCELIRKQSQVPIIMLTALSGEGEQIRGLDLQVDDYITKPFSHAHPNPQNRRRPAPQRQGPGG